MKRVKRDQNLAAVANENSTWTEGGNHDEDWTLRNNRRDHPSPWHRVGIRRSASRKCFPLRVLTRHQLQDFGGWTGGSGQVAGGWTPFPGTGQGLWKASVNYIGKAMFGDGVHVHVVYVVGGSFDLLFTNGTTVLGTVIPGTPPKVSTVTWPPSVLGDIGCGKGVAVVSVNVTITRGATGPGSFQGCLHDLPGGSVIPPQIWGTLQ